MLTFGNALKLRRGGEWVGGGAPSWSPAVLSPLVWLDADDSSTVTDSGGGAVSQWASKGPFALIYGQGSGTARPILVSNAYNGRATVRFDGGDFLANTAELPLVRNARGFTVYAVALTTSAASQAVWSALTPSGGTDFRVLFAKTSATGTNHRCGYRQADGGTARTFDSAVTWGSNVLTCAGVLIDHLGDTGVWRIDGVQTAASALPDAPGLTTDANSSGSHVGSLGTGTTLWVGDICEVIVCARALDAGEVNRLESYLFAKWGI